ESSSGYRTDSWPVGQWEIGRPNLPLILRSERGTREPRRIWAPKRIHRSFEARGRKRTGSSGRRASEIHLVAALERQDFARLVGRGDFEAEALDDLAHLGDLLRVRLGQLAGADPERVLHADADVAAHRQHLRRDA